MSTVTQRISEISQPEGGFLNPKSMEVKVFDDGRILNISENIHPSTVGMVVDYMTRFLNGAKTEKAFEISIKGANNKASIRKDDSIEQINMLLDGITGVNDESIINACKAVSYDIWYRNAQYALNNESEAFVIPDNGTISNIKIMLERSEEFFAEYGPVVNTGITFMPYGYTSTVDKGDGDFLTKNGLWDFKVSKNEPQAKDTLQILMYYIMSQHCAKQEYLDVEQIGIFNPRLNKAYVIDVNSLSVDVLKHVESDVICYNYSIYDDWLSEKILRHSRIGKWTIPAKTRETAVLICKKANSLDFIIHSEVSNPYKKRIECYLYMYEDDIDGHITLLELLNDNNYLPKDKNGNYKDLLFKLLPNEFSVGYEGVFDKPLRLSHIIDLEKGVWNESFLDKKDRFKKRRTIEEKIEKYGRTYKYFAWANDQLCKEHRFNGEYVLSSIKELNMTTKDLAAMLGVTERTIKSWLSGKSKPLLGNAITLCVNLNLDEDKVILK